MAIGWLPWGLRATIKAIGRHNCAAIYSSAPCWTTHLIALLAKRLTGLPWVADFRDPWRGTPMRRDIPYASIDRVDAWLESQVVRGADYVICNTEPARRDFMSRFPQRKGRFVTVPNGFDPEDFIDLMPRRTVDEKSFVLTHAGNFYATRRPEPLFKAVRMLQDRGELGRPICLQLLGQRDFEGEPLDQLAGQYGIGSSVRLLGQVAHRKALEYMLGSDVLLAVGLCGGIVEPQVPGKLYEYFGVGKPVVAIAARDGAIADIMTRAGLADQVGDPDHPETIADILFRIASDRREDSLVPADPAGTLRQFHRRYQVGRIAALLGARYSGDKRFPQTSPRPVAVPSSCGLFERPQDPV